MAGRKDLTGRQWTDHTRPRILARDNYTCQSCGVTAADLKRGKADLTVDHIEPVAVTGRTEYADHELLTLCRSCNSRKGARPAPRKDYRNPKYQ